ncbi:MAG: adenylate cyclase, partial [Oligoflexales bacterium]|nr:adenylate cyclase [Oligoflexales bacterium]
VLLTAKTDDPSKAAGIKKGAHAYVGKPFDELELASTIDNLFQLKKGEEKIKELNRNLTEQVLKRFLPAKLVNDIVDGVKTLDDSPRLMDVTILFSDLADFTKKSEEYGAKKMSLLLNKYLDIMTETIFDCGGVVDKFMGDGIMVIFGAPEEDRPKDQVEKSVKCAFAMQESLERLNREWNSEGIESFKMRIGIHHGRGLVGTFGGKRRTEFTVLGPIVNMASRIERLAPPGEIFFSGSVRDLIAAEYDWDKAGVFSLRGIGDSMLFKLKNPKEKKAA